MSKIRGHKRRWKSIDKWIANHITLDLKSLEEEERQWVKVRIPPWIGFSHTSYRVPEPRGKTKLKILEGLIAIYRSWKTTLEANKKDYYLKLWLFEPRFSQSQVVCAIGDSIEFYKNTFNKSAIGKPLNLNNFGRLQPQIASFMWEERMDQDIFEAVGEEDLPLYASRKDYEEDRIESQAMFVRADDVTEIQRSDGKSTQVYFITQGKVYLGGHK